MSNDPKSPDSEITLPMVEAGHSVADVTASPSVAKASKTMSREQKERVQKRVKEWLKPGTGIKEKHIVQATGLSQTQINNAKNLATVGWGVAAVLAAYDEVTLEEFIGPVPEPLDGLLKDKSMRKRWSEAAINCVLQTAFRMLPEQRNALDEEYWFGLLNQIHAAITPIIDSRRPKTPPPPKKSSRKSDTET